nr:MAG: replicase [Xinjiang alphaflexi-like virus 2]
MSVVRATLDSFRDCGVKAAIEEASLKHVREELKSIRTTNPYAVPLNAADALESLGVATDPYSIKLHTHAADKALENRMLQIVGQNLPKEPCTFLYLKPVKLQYLRRGPQAGDFFINQRKEPRDILRYPEDTVQDQLTGINTKTAYLSDTLHFLNPRQLVSIFHNSPKLETLLATVVLPVEAKFKHNSLYPEVYTINYGHGGFQYLPGGHGGGYYAHEFIHLQWLSLGKVTAGPHVLTLQKIESLGSHHLFIVHRGDFIHPRLNVFEADSMVVLPKIFTPDHANANWPLRKTLAMQLLLYVKSIKQVTERDIYAKVRQLIKTSELTLFSPTQLIHLANFFLYVSALRSVNDYPSLAQSGVFGKIAAVVRARVAEIARVFTGDSQFQALLKLTEWETFSYTLDVKAVVLQPKREVPATPKPKPEGPAPRRTLAEEVQEILNREAHGATPKLASPTHSDSTTAADTPTTSDDEGSGTESDSEAGTSAPDPDDWPMATKFKLPTVRLAQCLKVLVSDAANGIFEERPEHLHADELMLHLDLPVPPLGTHPENSTQRARAMALVDQGADIMGYWTNCKARLERRRSKAPHQEPTAVPARPAAGAGEVAPEGTEPEPQVDVLAPWRKVLDACGFQGIQPQEGPDGPILPIERVKSPTYPRATPRVDRALTEHLASMARHPRMFPLDRQRAAAFASDVKNQRVGALLKSQPREWLRSFSERCEVAELQVPLCVVHGAGGSGKSYALQAWARAATPGAFTVVCPSVELRNDWHKKLPRTPAEDIKTYEKAMMQPANDVVIFDDYGKLPAGFIEAYAVQHQSVELYILTGDFKQSVHFENNDEARTVSLLPAIDVFDEACDYYLNATHRNARTLANGLGVCSVNHTPLKISTGSAPNSSWPVLVPGTKKKNALAEAETRAMTYAGCQGLTAPKVNIVIDNATANCSERVLYTALSRAVDEIHFVSSSVDDPGFWAKMEATPYLKTFLSFVREHSADEYEAPEPEPPADEAPRTHLPVDPASALLEDLAHQIPDKYARELHSRAHGHSNAIQTDNPIIQLFAHQQAKDETLMDATMAKRITISNPAANEKEFVLKKDIGDVLFANYRRAMHLPSQPIPFEEELWQSCRAEVERTYTSKTVAQLINGQARQSPDFDEHKIALFLKSQWVKKTEKLGCLKVKEGQTIASFMQETVMVYGTMARYMRRIRDRYQPANIFINCERTPEQLDKWVEGNWRFNRKASANDYTSYDKGNSSDS